MVAMTTSGYYIWLNLGGLAWYIPVTDPRPWRKPLKERQAHAVSMDTWPAVELHYHSRSDYGSSTKNSRMDEDHRHLRLSLQVSCKVRDLSDIQNSTEQRIPAYDFSVSVTHQAHQIQASVSHLLNKVDIYFIICLIYLSIRLKGGNDGFVMVR